MTRPAPTMADIAAAVGLSKNAVSLAFRHDPQIPAATRERILAAAAHLGYEYDPMASAILARVRSKGRGKQAALGVIQAHRDPEAWHNHPTVPIYLAGVQRRARERGYNLDRFWLHDPKVRGEALSRILHARGIRGLLVCGLMQTNRLPDHLLPLLEDFPCVVTGVRTREPALSFACVDHYELSLQAFEEAIRLGYRRPGLVLSNVIDELIEGRFSAGYVMGQRAIPKTRHLRPFYEVNAARKDLSLFESWLKTERPDMILTLYHEVGTWVQRLGLRIPEDLGMASLEWRADQPSWAGMEQHNELVGEAAVDMLIGMLHRGERGVPQFPRAFLIGSSWVPGATLPPRDPARSAPASLGGAHSR